MPTRPFVAALAGMVALSGCGPDPTGEDRPESSVARETVVAADHLEVWSRLIAAGIDESMDVSGDPTSRAASLLATLDGHLRTHVVVVAHATEAHLRDRDAAFRAATAVVDDIREALVSTLSELYDEEVASAFEDPWRLLTEHTYRYARALRAGDDGGARTAAEEMHRLAGEIAEQLSDMTGGLLDASVFEEALVRMVEGTTRVIRQQHARDEPWAEVLHRAVETVSEPAELLAAAIAQDRRLHGEVGAAAVLLRADLTAAMAGTAWFAPFLASTARAGDAVPDETIRVLEQQTDALRRAFARVLDAAPAADLAVSWHRHHELLADLADVLIGADAVSGADAVEDELARWAASFARRLEEATDGALDVAAMEREARRHVETIRAVLRAQAGRT